LARSRPDPVRFSFPGEPDHGGSDSTTGEWMRLASRLVSAILFSGIALSALSFHLLSQEPGSRQVLIAVEDPPEAPQPQFPSASVDPVSHEALPAQSPSSSQTAPVSTPEQNPAQNSTPVQAQPPAAEGSSSSQTPAQQSADEKSRREKAEEQLKQQEKQRVMGVMATFNTTRNKDALPLSPGQKFQLFFKSSTDPWPFMLASVVAGIGQANDSYPEWGQGVQGYAKRFGGAYTDAFIGNFFGNAVLPVVLREDPRYFQKGTGSFAGRALWAASSTFWCKRDKGGWGPNYANVGGNLIGAAIARAYYPPSERDVASTISDGLTVSVEGIVGAEVIEFWPDMVRNHRRKQAEKLARSQAAAEGKAPPNQIQNQK